MTRFIYHGHALALGGFLHKPTATPITDHCACVLPSVGGRITTRSGAYRLSDPATGRLLVGYQSAECYAAGFETETGERRTELRVMVRGLDVLGVLRAEEIVASISVVHPRNGAVRTDTAGSRFTGLSVGGRPLEIALEHDLSRKASDYAGLRTARKDLRESRGVIRSSLARNDLLRFEEWEHGYLDHAGVGRIYFCEWWAAPYRQGLTMVRLRLGSPVEGQLEVGTLEVDGHDYP